MRPSRNSGTGMALRIEVTQSARDDLDAILGCLSGTLGSPQAAGALLDGFDSFLETVGTLPESYPRCHDGRLRARGYRRAIVRCYVVLYRLGDEAVHMAHVFHSSQDYARLV